MKKLNVGQHGWAVVDSNGDIGDVYMHEVTRDDLVLLDTERIVEVVVTVIDHE